MKELRRRIFLRFFLLLLFFSVGLVVMHSFWGWWPSLMIGACAALGLSWMAAWEMAVRTTKPLEEIVAFTQHIAERKYSHRLPHFSQSWVKPLAVSVNQMLDQLQLQLRYIEENEQRMTGMLESMVSGVLLVNASGRILLVNTSVETMLGSPRRELLGRNHLAASHHYELGQLIDTALQERRRIKEEVTVYYPQERILDISISPIVLQGQQAGAVVVLHDITSIRRLEKLRTEFVANVSHELRTPVTAVKGFAETLLDGAMYDTGTLQYFLQIIYKEADRLHRLIGDLLDLSKIESRQVRLEWQLIELDQLLRETVATVRPQAQQHGLMLYEELPKVTVKGDRDRLQQIFLNLLSNAIAYTSEGGRITVRMTCETTHVRVEVADTGMGIPKKDIPRIFERFYRVDKARSRESGGTGLGLSIVKHLVDAHRGRVEVESRLGQGATFTVTLPYQQDV